MSEVKFCKDCKHYLEQKLDFGQRRSLCTRNAHEMKNPVTGKTYIDGYASCNSERDNYGFPKGLARVFFGFNDFCGPKAKHWEAK